ncbi:prolyl oligopeptidase family serine peptidase [Marinactinospora thermotolerans]|uniref:Alpha/beta hydrolase family protein n=1 Tax=Marinactinospora thermotolerans DSM 45154 TaxID=1122192 RepID=A0A1T4T1S4_9ACTN|nr:prolyl oligopeptidase family serine peptidase [Marinactinospora thermotolerans]SKA34460.1 Alpha/beta hydrolase family protein [Marinactinospora thermotolerans DSM 45154]
MVADGTLARPLTGFAAGVPYVAVPPYDGGAAPMVIALHAFEPPRSEAALAGTLPLTRLPAWRFYLGLPMFGARLPKGGVAEVNHLGQSDYLLHLYGPVIEQAAMELVEVAEELRERFPVHDGPFGLAGVGAGGAAALLALAESRLPIGAMAVVNPIIDPTPVLAARERHLGIAYHWSEQSREAAAWLDFTARAAEIGARAPLPPLLVITGGLDEVIRPEHGQAFHDALAPYHPAPALRHVVIPDLAHTMGPEPGLVPGPPTPGSVLVDRALTEWFHLHLTSAVEETVRFR